MPASPPILPRAMALASFYVGSEGSETEQGGGSALNKGNQSIPTMGGVATASPAGMLPGAWE
jgi:hypothetical protein